VGATQVDHVILGAGLAGLVLYRLLHRHKRVVVLDPAPGRWKIGEANVPEMFASPIFSALMEKIRRLPSFSQKNGSVFVGDDSFAVYPIVSNRADAVHVARDELEQLLLSEWDVPVVEERVTSLDVAGHVAHTESGSWESRGPIIDCSGAAMLVARSLGDVHKLWPIASVWRYYHIDGVDPPAFLRHMEATGRRGMVIDIPNIRRLPDEMLRDWAPHEATNLTKVADGTWMWQIPLFHAKMLSLGIVSRDDGVDEAALDEAAERHHARSYRIRPRPVRPGGSVYDQVHRRAGFALRAGRAATMDYLLVGDAFMFVDPIYSVGTSIAVNKALEAAALVADGWTAPRCEAFNQRYDALLARRTAAFESWYSEDTRANDENTRRVLHYFPDMTRFQAGITWQYARVVQATLQLTRRVNAASASLC
jgi:flavin-dependent dehydrogenase